jgi:ABC-type bacteriocin/lantibiotic exporter with double-glycine peptidase domain
MKDQRVIGISLIIFCIIMLAVVLLYRDTLITITSLFVVAVLIFQYVAPILRERSRGKKEDGAGKNGNSG